MRTRDRYPRADWKHFTFTYDGSGKAAGVKLYVDGKPAAAEIAERHARRFHPHRRRTADRRERTRCRQLQRRDRRSPLLRPRARRRPRSRTSACDYPVRAILSGIGGKLTKTEESRLRDYYLRHVADPSLRDQYAKPEGAAAAIRRAGKADPHHHGDGRNGEAARHLRARPRRLPESRREGRARRARDSAAAPAQRQTRHAPRPRPVAGRSRRIRSRRAWR